ncbi:hypothetical protein Pyrfu_0972 [Pyrolobus fumarii 1A]|uniref:Preflagellin peptidase C-terminal domain-containing protein n=1 Tax=Pyrolobus fumarii (strain DSM 11204 / 1A) TaxID=694429 RepID=G0EEL8_PYRF1|nr:A24 family peptidase C-terminal domain-containing protein [Pyrolobus fumarii]AEM38840.1 hypothetical protein Pyrfu_0972 [Pyrolobus fumarii 1A]
MSLVITAQHIAAIAFLILGSLFDLRSRAIPSWLPYIFIGTEAILLAYRVYTGSVPHTWQAYLVIDAFLLAAIAVLVLLCLKGMGDLLMFLGITLAEPFGATLLPAPLLTLLYYSLASLTISIYIAAHNIASSESRRQLSKLPLTKRVIRIFTARPVRAETIAKGSWWIPIDLPGAKDTVCSVEVDPSDIVKRAIAEGRVRPKDYLWATYGIPALVPLTVGFILALTLGDKPIILLLESLIHKR